MSIEKGDLTLVLNIILNNPVLGIIISLFLKKLHNRTTAVMQLCSDVVMQKFLEREIKSSEIFKQALIDYLKSSSVRFKPQIQGDTNRKSFTGLIPQVNDIIIYKDHNNQPRFGIIQRILEKNRVAVKTTHYKRIDELVMHVRKISLIYRLKENKGHFPLNLERKVNK